MRPDSSVAGPPCTFWQYRYNKKEAAQQRGLSQNATRALLGIFLIFDYQGPVTTAVYVLEIHPGDCRFFLLRLTFPRFPVALHVLDCVPQLPNVHPGSRPLAESVFGDLPPPAAE